MAIRGSKSRGETTNDLEHDSGRRERHHGDKMLQQRDICPLVQREMVMMMRYT